MSKSSTTNLSENEFQLQFLVTELKRGNFSLSQPFHINRKVKIVKEQLFDQAKISSV